MLDGPWCTVCGQAASAVQETLDPRRPIVYCRRSFTAKQEYRCGRVIGTRLIHEAEAVYSARRWKLTTAQHKRHDRDRDPVPWCRTCQDWQPGDVGHNGVRVGASNAPASATGRMD